MTNAKKANRPQVFLITSSLISTLCSLFGSAAQAAPGGAKIGVKAGVLDGVLNAGPMVQLLLLLMISLSVISWAIIFMKYRQYKVLREANAKFIDKFWHTNNLESLFKTMSEHGDSGLGRVFKAAYMELQRLADAASGGNKNQGNESTQIKLYGLDNLERAIRKAVDTEIGFAEGRLNFLATTGSTAPFVGLLGTVIGIMTSFSHIAASGSASLAVVAPGISEALFSTAMGLFAALPAVAAYNYYVSQVRKFEMDLNNFGSDFLNIAKRNFFQE
jgi:biopolymer transport protein TolQ